MRRAVILVMDSFGLGASEDADRYGDVGADTLGHIAEECAAGRADVPGTRTGLLALPNLVRLGLGCAAHASTGRVPPGLESGPAPEGLWGFAAERSRGKDTPSGHWEIAGVPVLFDWGYFPRRIPCLPVPLSKAIRARAAIPGILGNCHASGTEIIEDLGEEHLRTGKPIFYTSADSVLQIAAHEETFGLQRLYRLCEIAREEADEYEIGRVIARPFAGRRAGEFVRTGNRRDYATPPPEPTLLDRMSAEGREVVGIGKIGDIFAHRGLGRNLKADGNDALFDATLSAFRDSADGALVFSNFVDFDSVYGHRRNVPGYAAALEAFDHRIPEIETAMRPGDLAVITADHGCDPTWPGTDHTREHIPVIAFGPGISGRAVGRRETFADIGQTIAQHLGIPPLAAGESFLTPIHSEVP